MNQILPIAGLLCLVILAVVAWTASLRKQVRRQTDAMRTQLHRELVLGELGKKLAVTGTVLEAARVIVDAADKLLGWDSCTVFLYFADKKVVAPVLTMDTVDGKKVDVPGTYKYGVEPSPMTKAVIENGAKLILRQAADGPGDNNLRSFGVGRRSASLMFVRMHDESQVIGVMSIQSYTVNFYDEQKLQILQFLADHCAGALERIRAREALKISHDQLETQVESRVAELNRSNTLLQQESQERKFIFDSVPAMICYKDAQNTNVRVNKFAAELIGLPVEQIEGRTDFDLMPQYAEQYYRDDLEVIRSGQPKLGIIQPYLRANHETRWLQTDKIPYRDMTGKVTGVIVFATDITERKLLSESLQRANDQLEKRIEERTAELTQAIALVKQEMADRRQAEVRNEALSRLGQELSLATNAAAAGHIILDVADRLLKWDAAYLHLFTADLKKNIPVLMFDIIDGRRTEVADKDTNFSARDRRTIEHGAELINTPSQNSLAFGNNNPCASKLYVPIRNGSKVIGVMSVQSYTENAYNAEGLNILQALGDFCAGTLERIQAEQSLRQSEERFSTAFRFSPIPMSLSSLDESTFLDVNDSLLRFLGFTREEMLGHKALELGIWAQPSEREAMTALLREKKPIREWPCQMRTKAGTVRDVLISVEPMAFSGRPNILSIIQDVTERLNLEAQLRQSQKMEAVGQLAAGVAHDFNNVLTIIQGHSGLLLQTPELEDSVSKSLTQISAAADRAGSLTRQLLTFSRKQVMQPVELDLNAVVSRATHMMQRLLGENIRLHFDYTLPLPAIHADPGMMEQIVVNLAVNSRDAMANGGTLTIATRLVEMGVADMQRNPEARAGRFACLIVTDTGSGMDEATKLRIFEPFFTTKQVGKGTGLGLATVYGIVKQHQGWIEVDSQLQQGTQFKIFLPAGTDQALPAADQTPAIVLPGGSETILVVEDEFALRELVRSLLEHFGYRVLEAAHGKEALKIWAEQKDQIDLLLTDMMMPEGLSGWQLAERLQQERPDLKVIYTSGYSVDLFGQNRELREGVNFLPKPYHPAKLAKSIRDCLDTPASKPAV